MLTKVALLVCLVISTADVIKRKDKGSPVKRQFGCSVNEFQCVSTGHCIQEEWTCDSQDDCGDNSDEAVPVPCAQNPAACLGPHVVRCNNGRCVPVEFRCDSDNDCGDNTDEIACDNFECPPEEFKCANGLCINARWRCDREDDCGDGSDEVNC